MAGNSGTAFRPSPAWVLTDGKELVGRLATREGKLEIATGAGNPVEVSKERVVALLS